MTRRHKFNFKHSRGELGTQILLTSMRIYISIWILKASSPPITARLDLNFFVAGLGILLNHLWSQSEAFWKLTLHRKQSRLSVLHFLRWQFSIEKQRYVKNASSKFATVISSLSTSLSVIMVNTYLGLFLNYWEIIPVLYWCSSTKLWLKCIESFV